MNKIEEKIKDTAKFKFICKYNGKKDLKSCILEAIFEETHLTETSLALVFGSLYPDEYTNIDNWVNKIYEQMEREYGIRR